MLPRYMNIHIRISDSDLCMKQLCTSSLMEVRQSMCFKHGDELQYATRRDSYLRMSHVRLMIFMRTGVRWL